jgi:hypothetical protein
MRGRKMTGLEALENVRYVTVKGKRLAVVDAAEWESLIEWLETLEDIEVAKATYDSLANSSGDRDRAGWLKWDDVREELRRKMQ